MNSSFLSCQIFEMLDIQTYLVQAKPNVCPLKIETQTSNNWGIWRIKI